MAAPAAPPPPPARQRLPPPPPSLPPPPSFCNCCLSEIKLFDDVPPTGGGRIPKRYYTNCCHVLCQNCKMRYNNQCAACKKPCKFMEINDQMNPLYRSYFEPSVKMRSNLVGAVQFQSTQSEYMASRTLAQAKYLTTKCRESGQKLAEAKNEHKKVLGEHRKIMIIFNSIRDAKKRQDGKKRLASQQRHQQRPLRRSSRPSPDWFDEANQNHAHGRGHDHGRNNNGNEWTRGYDATTTAQTNFGETPRTYRPFADAPSARLHQRQQANFLNPFQ